MSRRSSCCVRGLATYNVAMSTVNTKNAITISQAAEQFGVSPQRMHQLIAAYEVETICVNPRLKLVEQKELRKIPEHRPTGIKK